MTPPSQLGVVALVGALAFASATAIGAGCTVLTNDAPLDDAGVFEAGDGGGAACSTCVAGECTVATALCLTAPSCIAVRTCGSGTACTNACTAAEAADGGTKPALLHRAFATCNDARTCGTCATECDGRCATTRSPAGSPCDPDAGTASDAGDAATADDAGDGGGSQAGSPTAESCGTCGRERCVDATKACAIGSECASFLACAVACADSACIDDCGRLHATGKVAAVELAACTQAACGAECGLLIR